MHYAAYVFQKTNHANNGGQSFPEFLRNKEAINIEREKLKERMKEFDAAHGGWMKKRNEDEEIAVAQEIMAHKSAGVLRDCWGVVRQGLSIVHDHERHDFVSSRMNGLKECVREGNLLMELWACLLLSHEPHCFYYFPRAIACALLLPHRCQEGNYILEMLIYDEEQAMHAIEELLRVACKRFWGRVRYIACWSPPTTSPRERIEV
eukprot:GHVU01004494.1.p1 GENE.GHVU01004494.1~~GHVU01004494.1.p1  ORF type:complete len:206 (-),score=24.81 GHVU01004494.1:369-986(-)